MSSTSPTKTLLSIFAHPDDESFGPGGTLAKYAAQGVAVHHVCGTRGEVGSADPQHLAGYASVGDMRWAELQCAAQHLDLASVIHLGYRDSGMPGSADNQHPQALAAAPIAEVAAKIAHLIRELKPQVVITHDPVGGYRHPDHIAIHQATVAAFHAASDPTVFPDGLPGHVPQKLYYPVFGGALIRLFRWIVPVLGQDLRRMGRNKDIDFSGFNFPTHAVIDIHGAPALKKFKAWACHRSQTEGGGGPPTRGVIGWYLRQFGSRVETFMRAHPPANGHVRERDLFEGVM
ncbi:MAG: PIG-L family deacetylase [Chloroflexi bacterium]|nr:PIG-L family deacetylase [Chloroflexota bacterium]